MNAVETKNTQACITSVDCHSAGCGCGIKVKTKFQPAESQRVIGSDAFSGYFRPFKEDDAEAIQTSVITSQGQGPFTKRRKGSTAQPILVQADGGGGIRPTRISFDADPSLFMYDEIIRMLEQVDCANISDDEDEESKLSEETYSDDAASTSKGKDERKRSGVREMLDELRSIRDLYLGMEEDD